MNADVRTGAVVSNEALYFKLSQPVGDEEAAQDKLKAFLEQVVALREQMGIPELVVEAGVMCTTEDGDTVLATLGVGRGRPQTTAKLAATAYRTHVLPVMKEAAELETIAGLTRGRNLGLPHVYWMSGGVDRSEFAQAT